MATPRLPQANDPSDVAALVAAVFEDRPVVRLQELGPALGLEYSKIKSAASKGELPVVRTSPRRIVVTRQGLHRYLSNVNGLEPVSESPQSGAL
jgi:hypothetical protein